jgi:hypothetical protein
MNVNTMVVKTKLCVRSPVAFAPFSIRSSAAGSETPLPPVSSKLGYVFKKYQSKAGGEQPL